MRAALTGLLALLLMPAVGRAAPVPPFPELFPDATRFAEEAGPPAATAAFRGDELLGWAFSSGETVGSVGYSGRALDILVGLDVQGRIAGARLLSEEEPIFAAARTRAELERFLGDYRGKPIDAALDVRRGGGGAGSVAAVSGATISSLVINDAILRAARAVARAKGIFGQPGGIDRKTFEPVTGPRWWPTARSPGTGSALATPRRCWRATACAPTPPRAVIRRACSWSCSWGSPPRPGSAATSRPRRPSPG
jgi:transcriptional regulator of nitric oxide reductase